MKLRKINDIHFVITHGNPTTNGDYAIHSITLNVSQHHSKDNSLSEGWEKIEFSTQPLECNKMWTPVNGKQWMCNTMLCCGKILNLKTKPISIQEVKELIGEVDVEKKASEYAINDFDDYAFCGYISGYNQALEDNKEKKYTEDDIRKAWNAAYIDAMSIDEETYKPLFFEDFIAQSLQPKTEWDVEFVDGKLKLK